MGKVEYSDLYKFMVSAGVALITLSVLAPWLFFREPFDLLVETSKLNNLTPDARWIIEKRQQGVYFVGGLVLFGSVVSLIAGVRILRVGLIEWKRVQSIADEQAAINLKNANLDTQKKTLEIESMSKKEVEEEAAEEIASATPPTLEAPQSTTDYPESISRYLEIEKRVVDLFRRITRADEVMEHQRIGRTRYDAIIRFSGPAPYDFIIEVKYFVAADRPSVTWVQQAVLQTMFLAQQYLHATQRPVKAHLVFVAHDRKTLDIIEQTAVETKEQSENLGEKLVLHFFTLYEIENLDDDEYEDLLAKVS